MRTILLLMLMTASAMAGTTSKEEAVKTAAFRLTVAYQCIPVTGDAKPYEWAKNDAARILASAGVDNPATSELLASVESEKQDAGENMTPQFCRDMLAGFGRE